MATLTPQLTFDGSLRLMNARRLIVLVPESLAPNASMMNQIYKMATRENREVFYLALVDGETKILSATRMVATLKALVSNGEITSDHRYTEELYLPDNFNEAFYWRHRFDPDEKHFKAIWRIVYVDGIDEPVIHEPWKGQQYDQQSGTYVGSCKFPIQVLTLGRNPMECSNINALRSIWIETSSDPQQFVALEFKRS